MMIGNRLDPKKEPFHRHAEVALFTAWKDERLVGRTSATVDRTWLETWKDDTGHFGFFDTIDDVDVARALLSEAEAWLRERGMKRMNGPMSLSPRMSPEDVAGASLSGLAEVVSLKTNTRHRTARLRRPSTYLLPG